MSEKMTQEASVVACLAATLGLDIPVGCDPIMALKLDIKRLQDVERLWGEACALAREHCPVGVGESHIHQGIPRLRAKCDALRDRAEVLERDAVLDALEWYVSPQGHDCPYNVRSKCSKAKNLLRAAGRKP